MPVPADAPPPPAEHPQGGAPNHVWTYRDAAGAVLGFVHRYDSAQGKEFRPLIYCRPAKGGKAAWRWQGWPTPRPLYGLAELTERPTAPVVVTEGEKAADAARRLLPEYAVVTSPYGSKSAAKADWTPVRGRRVTIWPDADAAGLAYAEAAVKALRAAGAVTIAIVSPPANVAVGWDAADAESVGWAPDQAAELVAKAVASDAPAPAPPAGDGVVGVKRKRVPQRDILIGLTESCDLWHDAASDAFVTFPVNGHRENWPIRSRRFRMWLAHRYFKETGTVIGSQALEDRLRILEARAVNSGPACEPVLRVGAAGDCLFLDFADETWRAAEIDARGWRIVDRPAVKFIRSASTRALDEPVAGELIERLREFVNASDADFMLIVSWLVASLRPTGPFPILVVNGEQGSGKSFVSKVLRLLVDPSAAPIRSTPKNEEDLIVSARNSCVLCFDNLSSIPGWFSDALARLSTGGGFATRLFYTNTDEAIFEGARPILINGIPSLTDRADLADRTLTIHLRTIPDDRRRDEKKQLWPAFEAARPAIVGALLDAVSAALRNLDSVEIGRLPRMADFARWIIAACPGLGWDPNAFLQAYNENRRYVAESAFEADAVAVAVADLVIKEHPQGLECTPTELLALLSAHISEATRKARSWPGSPNVLGGRMKRAAPLLRARGFAVEFVHSTTRAITIIPPRATSDEVPSAFTAPRPAG